MTNHTTSNEPPVLRLRSPEDLLAALPYVLGFHPTDSLVAVGYAGPRGRVAFTTRVDLPGPDPGGGNDAEAVAAQVAGMLHGNDVDTAMLVAYGTLGRAEPVLRLLRDRLDGLGIPVQEMLAVDGDRYWSLSCANPRCCPPEGRPYDLATSRVAAEATLAGLTALPDRAALERSVAPVDGAARDAIREATRRVEAQLHEWAAAAGGPGVLRQRLLDEGRRLVRHALDRYREGGGRLTDHEVALLGMLLTLQPMRDEAWLLVDAEWRAAHLELWIDMVQRVEEVYVPGPASLLAFTAWQRGEGALAQVAIDRALRVDPGYSMAHLIRDALVRGVPPVRWPQMSVQELRTMYDRLDSVPDQAEDEPEGVEDPARVEGPEGVEQGRGRRRRPVRRRPRRQTRERMRSRARARRRRRLVRRRLVR